jgi:hypothetical protein
MAQSRKTDGFLGKNPRVGVTTFLPGGIPAKQDAIRVGNGVNAFPKADGVNE